VKNSSKKHNFFLGFFAPDAYKLQPSYISDQNLQKITLNYFQSGVLTTVMSSSKKHNFFLLRSIQASAVNISDQNLQKITLNYFQSGVLTIIETTKIILRDVPR
jgi:hypothetical protein